jgi:ubiquinone/menaquinone biosynthesis C-methylase UbiE
LSETYNNKETAARYDSARGLPEETSQLWMEKLGSVVPGGRITIILDLGGGTGRFSGPLGNTYKCPVIVTDPSEAMLEEGKSRNLDLNWLCGLAERLPFSTDSVDLIWMSQVFHHLENAALAFQEIIRVLKPGGYLAIRNGTRESEVEIEWKEFFPEAVQIDQGRIPSRSVITDLVCQQGFELVEVQAIYQYFVSSYTEYYTKISQRGLSALIMINDEAFAAGLERLKRWTKKQIQNQPIYEPVDLFVFRKQLEVPK